MTDVVLRPIVADEYPDYIDVLCRCLNFPPPNPTQLAAAVARLPRDATLAGFDGAQIVSTASSHTREVTLPGGAILPFAAVTRVSVLPTHRRRGILTAMMRRQLAERREAGDAIAMLVASESVIYGRFGYGLAATSTSYEIDPRHAALRPAVETEPRLRLIGDDEAASALPPIFDAFRKRRTGQIDRPESWWSEWVTDHKRESIVVREPGDGFVRYTLEGAVVDVKLTVNDLVATNPDAELALWKHVFGVDLVVNVSAPFRAVDELLRWRLADPRRLKVTRMMDMLWARPLDVAAALSARRYAVPGSFVLDVRDSMFGDGRYALDGSPDGASCTTSTATPDVELSVADLGAVFLGGVSFTTLRDAGRIDVASDAVLRAADAMFATQPAPWCSTFF